LILLRPKIPQQFIEPPGHKLPAKAVGADAKTQSFGKIPEKIKGQEKLKIAETAEYVGQTLGYHPLHALALNKKQLGGKNVRLRFFSQNFSQVPKQIFRAVGDVEIEHEGLSLYVKTTGQLSHM
jgi:hypothetical protein